MCTHFASGVRADTGVCPYRWVSTMLVRDSPPLEGPGEVSPTSGDDRGAFFVYQQVKERVLYIVVKNREKRVTGGGATGDRCEAIGALWCVECVGLAVVFHWFLASLHAAELLYTLHV